MKRDCTELFLRYRDICCLVWNLGFWPDPDMRTMDCLLAFEDSMARLFEGMILRKFGFEERIKRWPGDEGGVAHFSVTAKHGGVELRIDRNLPMDASHVWGEPVVRVNMDNCQLKFVGFFDWQQLAPRHYRFLIVLIERLDERPDLAGRHALVEFGYCSIWFADDDVSAETEVHVAG